jgi:DNA-binding transcriptional MerR regulator
MSEVLPDKLYFRIGEVAELVGVEPHVLRYWETEFRMRPHRSSSGQRLYRKRDIERFLRVRRLLHSEGFTIAGARKVLSQKEDGVPRKQAAGVEVEQLQLAAQRLRDLRGELAAFRAELTEQSVTADS